MFLFPFLVHSSYLMSANCQPNLARDYLEFVDHCHTWPVASSPFLVQSSYLMSAFCQPNLARDYLEFVDHLP